MIIKGIIKVLFPTIVWAIIVLSITLYEVRFLYIIEESQFFIREIVFLPAYIAVALFIPFFVAGYFKRKIERFMEDENERS